MTTATRTARGLQVLARVASESEPEKVRTVATDGHNLWCDCPGWTAQTHYPGCRALTGSGTCQCRLTMNRDPATKTLRTCRHLREAQRHVDEAGGLSVVLGMLRMGIDVDLTSETTVAVQRQEREHADAIRAEARLVAQEFRRRGSIGPAPAADLEQRVEAAIRKFARQQPASRPATPSDRPAWLGGARAILLRD
jgi:hypothetical protein